uniref:4Fe-4S single cluster domain-containing protein n=1 Tax=Candidatus Kentrum sp. DK TaxID=2126562 RepID=A0A450TMG9_9GAMM|nr:MAG: 4Fe-4S single cluster domain-containing protein [Candidatus Kentron sp. DK]
MYTRDIPIKPRIRFAKFALFILSKKAFLFFLIRLIGLKKVWSKWPKNLDGNADFPRRRIALLINIFLPGRGEFDTQRSKIKMNPLGKEEVKSKVNEVSYGLGNGVPFAPRSLISHIRETSIYRKNKEYWFEFIIFTLQSIVKREQIKRRVLGITVDVTNRCNRACSHCFANSGMADLTEPVDFQVLLKALEDTIEKLGCTFFSILGGEPFMEEERIFGILKKFPYTFTQIYSNGSLISSRLISKLERHPNAGVLISIEGDEELTDEIRGNGAYKLAIRALELLKSSSVIWAHFLVGGGRPVACDA